jgi:succinate dehydrogenase/fumarate reductase flavoprotein subunit
VIGEANFSDHGANRLGASALMQGLSDGYFIVPLTVGDYLASAKPGPVSVDAPEVKQALDALADEKAGSAPSFFGTSVAATEHHPAKLYIGPSAKQLEYRATASDLDVVGVRSEQQDLEWSVRRGLQLQGRHVHYLCAAGPSERQTYHGGLPDEYSSSSLALSFAVSIGTQKPS